MKKPFQVGDRVAVYDGNQRIIGKLVSELDKDWKGNQVFYMSWDYDIIVVNAKQCRRLVPKKRKEIWVNLGPEDNTFNGRVYFNREDAERDVRGYATRFYTTTRFVEAKEKKK